MRIAKQVAIWMALTGMIIVSPSLSAGQALTGSPSSPDYKYSTSMRPGIAAPDKVETRLGTLNFSDGFPDSAAVEKLYSNLDFQRAVQAYLLAIPVVSQATNRNTIRELGPVNGTVPIFEQLLDSRSVFRVVTQSRWIPGRLNSPSTAYITDRGRAISMHSFSCWASAEPEVRRRPS